MKTLSIILSFRDRDILRVRKCLDSLAAQSFTEFSVVFVDYGSSLEMARHAEELVSDYPFALYVYSHTRGMVWNRSRALNTGLHVTNAPYILFGDIDLIYDADFLRCVMERARPNSLVSTPVHYLSEGAAVPSRNTLVSNPLPISGVPNGAVLLLAKSVLEKLNGFDEYYCFWGVEDRDIYARLKLLGIEHNLVAPYEAPVFHQWHPVVSDQKRHFFPDRWWDIMNIYYQSQIKILRRNPAGMGKLFTEEDRPVLSAIAKDFSFPLTGDSYTKAQTICSLVQAVADLQPHEALHFELPFLTSAQALKRKIREAYALLRNKPAPSFYPQEDIFYTVWELIQRGEISDYFFEYHADRLAYTITGRLPQ